MSNGTKTTTDHDTIRAWAEERGGKPTVVAATAGDDGGILRFDFPGYGGGDDLEEITWDEFFSTFEDRGLALVYQEETADGERSNFSQFVSR